MVNKLVRPGDVIFPVRTFRVSTVVLAPGKLTIQQTDVHRRHFRAVVILRDPQIFCALEPEYGLRGNSSHEAAFLVQPLCVALFRNSIADECQPRRTQRNQLMSVYR